MVYFIIFSFIAGEAFFILLYNKWLKRSFEERLDLKIKYAKEKYDVRRVIPVHQKKVTFIIAGMFIPALFCGCLLTGYYLAHQGGFIAVGYFGGGAIALLILSIHVYRAVILLSEKPVMLVFHSYKKEETVLPYSEILFYKRARAFLHLKTKQKTYFIDYNNVNFYELIKRLEQYKIPEKKNLFQKIFNV